MTDADPRSLREGDLDDRVEYLTRLLDRVERHGDDAAAETVRELVRDYPSYHRTLFCRAMNRAAVFGDASLARPLLAAVADSRYNCQAWAMMGCIALDIRSVVPELPAFLNHPQWMAREQAVIGLGQLGDESVVDALVPLLGDSADWMRARCAEALSTIGGDAALAALWQELVHRRYQRIGYVASALSRFDPDVVIPRLLEVAGGDDPDQRYWAAVALGSTGDDRAVPMLEHLLATDRGRTVFDGEVRAAAKKALRTLRRVQAAIAAREESSRDDS